MILENPKEAQKYSGSASDPHTDNEPVTSPSRPLAQVTDDAPPPYYSFERELGISTDPPAALDFSTVKGIRIEKFRGSISGTYCIDPDVSGDDSAQSQGRTNDRRAELRLGKTTGLFSSPDASFRARHGAISLNLAIKGPSEQCKHATVDVANIYGDISVDFQSLHSGNHLNLSVCSRRGRITVLLPRNFCGDVQISNRKRGGYDILPGLASSIRNMKGQRRKTTLYVGEGSLSPGRSLSDAAVDHCWVTSRFGKIVVGLSGEDEMPVKQQGDNLWKQLGAYFRGSSNNACVN
ncbi:hypothetical protein BV22DRAFT_1031926 [Leucogyrophana mollusca]|uniref:Uncharacterized protein n=1 Tax=Leucogyrophana mollusca TaxID=85980 RepID=A0ACB8BQ22_9AGAM|nr:hypothetical protein BV22DRAFT_1031926 [Leucogyrophana mollusca]